jgi:hypothetical protein
MVFAWVFAIASLIALAFAKVFFVLSPGFGILYLSLTLIALTPWMFPVIEAVRRDAIEPHSPITRSGIIGLLCIGLTTFMSYLLGFSAFWVAFIGIVLIAIVFHIESRLFFVAALGSLIVTIVALMYGVTSLAESASVFVYIMLVI